MKTIIFLVLILSSNIFNSSSRQKDAYPTIGFEKNGKSKKIRNRASLKLIDNDGKIYQVPILNNKFLDIEILEKIPSKWVNVVFKNGRYKIEMDSVLVSRLKFDLVFGIKTKKYISPALIKNLEADIKKVESLHYLYFRPRVKYEGVIKYKIINK